MANVVKSTFTKYFPRKKKAKLNQYFLSVPMESEIKEGGGCVSAKAINFVEQA